MALTFLFFAGLLSYAGSGYQLRFYVLLLCAGSSAINPPTLTVAAATAEEIQLQCSVLCSDSIQWNRGLSTDYLSTLIHSSGDDSDIFNMDVITFDRNDNNCSSDEIMREKIYTLTIDIQHLTLDNIMTMLPNVSCVKTHSTIFSQLVNLVDIFLSVSQGKKYNCCCFYLHMQS